MGECLLSLGVIQKHFLPTIPLSTRRSPINATPSSSSSSSSSSTTTTTTTTTLSFGERYLVDSCGLSMESAVSASKKLMLLRGTYLRDTQLAIQCFKAYGFTHAHIAEMIEKEPWTLHCSVGSTLRPKLDFLTEIGFVGQLLPDLISKDPFILNRSLQNHLMVRHRLLRPYFDSDEAFVRCVLSYTWILSRSFSKTVKANLDLLAQEGVPRNSVGLLLSAVPHLITKSPEKFAFILRTVKGFGIDPLSSKFVTAVRSLSRLDESTWNKNIELLKTTLGWSQEDLSIAVRKYPGFISLSEENLRNKLNFYMNTIKLEPQDLIAYPVILNYSLDTRIRPRWNVLQVLMSNDLVEKGINVKVVLVISNKSFLEKYVTRHAHKIPELLGMYPGAAIRK